MEFEFFGYKISIVEKNAVYKPIKDKDLDILGCKVGVNKKEWDAACKPVKDEICYTSCKYKDACSREECYMFFNVAPSDLPVELKEIDRTEDRQAIQEYINEMDFSQDILDRKEQLKETGFNEKFVYYYRTCFHYGFTSGLYDEDTELQIISEALSLKGHQHIVCPFEFGKAIIVPLEAMNSEKLEKEVERYMNKSTMKNMIGAIFLGSCLILLAAMAISGLYNMVFK